jgi:hypothetical protein
MVHDWEVGRRRIKLAKGLLFQEHCRPDCNLATEAISFSLSRVCRDMNRGPLPGRKDSISIYVTVDDSSVAGARPEL